MRGINTFGSQWAAHVVLVAGVYAVIVAVALVVEAAVYRRRAKATVAELLRWVGAQRPSLEGDADPSSPSSPPGPGHRGRNSSASPD